MTEGLKLNLVRKKRNETRKREPQIERKVLCFSCKRKGHYKSMQICTKKHYFCNQECLDNHRKKVDGN